MQELRTSQVVGECGDGRTPELISKFHAGKNRSRAGKVKPSMWTPQNSKFCHG